MKTKMLNKSAMIRNINGLSIGDRAYCGPYGTITCYRAAGYGTKRGRRNARKFTIFNSIKLNDGSDWTMKSIREAIEK